MGRQPRGRADAPPRTRDHRRGIRAPRARARDATAVELKSPHAGLCAEASARDVFRPGELRPGDTRVRGPELPGSHQRRSALDRRRCGNAPGEPARRTKGGPRNGRFPAAEGCARHRRHQLVHRGRRRDLVPARCGSRVRTRRDWLSRARAGNRRQLRRAAQGSHGIGCFLPDPGWRVRVDLAPAGTRTIVAIRQAADGNAGNAEREAGVIAHDFGRALPFAGGSRAGEPAATADSPGAGLLRPEHSRRSARCSGELPRSAWRHSCSRS